MSGHVAGGEQGRHAGLGLAVALMYRFADDVEGLAQPVRRQRGIGDQRGAERAQIDGFLARARRSYLLEFPAVRGERTAVHQLHPPLLHGKPRKRVGQRAGAPGPAARVPERTTGQERGIGIAHRITTGEIVVDGKTTFGKTTLPAGSVLCFDYPRYHASGYSNPAHFDGAMPADSPWRTDFPRTASPHPGLSPDPRPVGRHLAQRRAVGSRHLDGARRAAAAAGGPLLPRNGPKILSGGPGNCSKPVRCPASMERTPQRCRRPNWRPPFSSR